MSVFLDLRELLDLLEHLHDNGPQRSILWSTVMELKSEPFGLCSFGLLGWIWRLYVLTLYHVNIKIFLLFKHKWKVRDREGIRDTHDFLNWNGFLSRPETGTRDPLLEVRKSYRTDCSHRNKWFPKIRCGLWDCYNEYHHWSSVRHWRTRGFADLSLQSVYGSIGTSGSFLRPVVLSSLEGTNRYKECNNGSLITTDRYWGDSFLFTCKTRILNGPDGYRLKIRHRKITLFGIGTYIVESHSSHSERSFNGFDSNWTP